VSNIQVLATERQIRQAVRRIAREVSRRYQEESILLVGVLTGAFVFMADLARELYRMGMTDVEIEFIDISSYSGTESGQIRFDRDLTVPISGRHVVIVEDIIDTGATLAFLLKLLEVREPASLIVVALFNKVTRRVETLPSERIITGIDLPNKFVVGYGLDRNGKFRHLPFVGIVAS